MQARTAVLLTFGLALWTAGCETKCEITCADGFKMTWPHECNDELTTELAKDHGGSCTGDEHK